MSSTPNSVASVADIIVRLRGYPSTTVIDSYVILDQTVAASLISQYLMQGSAWLRAFSSTIYITTDPYQTEQIRDFEIHYACAYLLASMAGITITDGFNLQVNGVSQSRFEAKFQEYKSYVEFHVNAMKQFLWAIDPMFYLVAQVYPLGVDVYGAPLTVPTYPSTIY